MPAPPTQRPPDVTIDDLAEPRFPPEVEALRESVVPLAEGIELTSDALLAAASAQTGLDDFGDDWFREPLEVFLAALRDEADLSAFGRVAANGLVHQLLVNRLLVEDLLRRHPEIHDVEIERPIVVAGLPRTGTTHLHNLMASDGALRSLPYWEAIQPVLAPDEEPGPGEPDPRLARTDAALRTVNEAMPYFKRMHEMTTDHAHEEIQLLAIDFSSMLFETTAMIPSWRDWWRANDQTPAYLYLKTILKVLQWSRGGTRWVLKSPQHLEQFGPLMAAFPDATVAVTHRDPVAVTASVTTMLAYTARNHTDRVDLAELGRYWSDRIEDLLAACVRDRELLPADQSIDVRFHEFMADDVAMVERIYDVADQPFTDDARSSIAAFMDDHPRGRHGRVRYDLAQFGLDRDERRQALRFYAERFGTEDEQPG